MNDAINYQPRLFFLKICMIFGLSKYKIYLLMMQI